LCVEEDIALYRSINSYPKLLQKSVHGSPDRFPQEAEMIREAYVAVRSDIVEREAAELAKRKEQVDGARLSTDLRNIVQAAFEGRAGWFYFDEAARTMKEFDGYGHRSWEKEDLHNLAAVQTILHGGEAFALPKEMMPNGASATAILRF